MSSGPILNDSLYSDPGNWCAEKNKTYANGYVYVSGVLCMSIGAWKIVADAISIVIATSLLLGLILAATKNRLWYRCKSFKLILHFVSNPLYQWMCQATLLVLQIPYQNDFYLAWAIFFFIQFGSFYTFLGYNGTSTDKQKEVILREWINFTGSINVLWLLLFIYQPPKLRHPLFILWALSILKIGERVWGFLAADRKYGSKHTKLVALYMASEREDNPEYDPLTMRGYKYLVHKEAESVVCPSNYYARLKTAKVTTLDEVWNCQGRLLKEADKRSGLLKDECLSFALFKLLKRRFEGLAAGEAKERKTRAFLLGLLSEEGERVFRVIKMELGFMSDHLYSKQLVTFGPFLVICNVTLVFGVIGVTIWIVSIIHKLRHDPKKIPKDEHSGIDSGLTMVFVGLLLFTELWELISYFFCGWGKITFICKYIKHYKRMDAMHLDKLFRFVCFRFPRSLFNFIPQYSLLHNHMPCSGRALCCFKEGKKRDRSVKLSVHVKRAICNYVKNLLEENLENSGPVLTNGYSTLSKHEVNEKLGWACGIGAKKDEHTHVHTIFIWHIATSYCELELKSREMDDNPELKSRKKVATTISNYCAYLFVFEPTFLPIYTHGNEVIFNNILTETREFLGKCDKDKIYQRMVEADIGGERIIDKGVRLGRQLISEINNDIQRWKLLEEFWAELIIFLAPSKHHMIHQQTLGDGGELITIIWVMLYHAGGIKRKSESHDGMLPV